MRYKFLKLNIKNNYLFFGIAVFTLITFGIPNKVFSASISVVAENNFSAGDTGIVDVFIDTQGELINSLDGSITLDHNQKDGFEIKEFSLVNSVFNVWPRKPSLEKSQTIFFIGGVGGGVNGNHLLLFKIIVKFNKAGNFSVKTNDITAYLNDGLGTARNIMSELTNILINVSSGNIKDNWQEIILNDKKSPLPFTVAVGQDINLFDGKKFIFFETTDEESGIDHYEVKERDYPSTRTDTNYVLIDQDKNAEVVVTAYDKAGNSQISVFKEKKPVNYLIIIVLLIVIVFIYQVIKKVFSYKKEKNV